MAAIQVLLFAVCALPVEGFSMIGKTLGHYQITEKPGAGGMGVVYKARRLHLDRFVAIKTLPPERVADPDRKRRKATPPEHTRYGLHIELAGILFGILPVTIEAVLRVLMPRLSLPGADFCYLTVVLIPVALVMAVMRQRRAKEYVDDTLSRY
jgi:serine/threonine protein kinase